MQSGLNVLHTLRMLDQHTPLPAEITYKLQQYFEAEHSSKTSFNLSGIQTISPAHRTVLFAAKFKKREKPQEVLIGIVITESRISVVFIFLFQFSSGN